MLEILTHSVMFDGKKDGVENDAEGDNDVEDGVVDDGEKDILGLEPAGIVEAARSAAGTVAIIPSF